jgi:hypothetical protein
LSTRLENIADHYFFSLDFDSIFPQHAIKRKSIYIVLLLRDISLCYDLVFSHDVMISLFMAVLIRLYFGFDDSAIKEGIWSDGCVLRQTWR